MGEITKILTKQKQNPANQLLSTEHINHEQVECLYREVQEGQLQNLGKDYPWSNLTVKSGSLFSVKRRIVDNDNSSFILCKILLAMREIHSADQTKCRKANCAYYRTSLP